MPEELAFIGDLHLAGVAKRKLGDSTLDLLAVYDFMQPELHKALDVDGNDACSPAADLTAMLSAITARSSFLTSTKSRCAKAGASCDNLIVANSMHSSEHMQGSRPVLQHFSCSGRERIESRRAAAVCSSMLALSAG